MDVVQRLKVLQRECRNCHVCAIGGKKTPEGDDANVLSDMNVSNIGIMIVGQNPGREECKQRVPFVGASGKTFDALMEKHAGIKRSEVYVCNCVNCYTPLNRKPTELEINNCSAFLTQQIAIIQPKLVVSLGGTALRALTGLNGIMKYHGHLQYSYMYNVKIFPLIHPSPRNLNVPEKRQMFCDDLGLLRSALKKLGVR
jgi:DNA polymerase